MTRSAALALALVAIGVPLATWLHARAQAEASALASRDAHAADLRGLDAELRTARADRFEAAARDTDRSCETRTSAARFLAEELTSEAPTTSKWATDGLADTRCPHPQYPGAPTLGRLIDDPRVHDDIVKAFGNLERNKTLKELIRLGQEADDAQRAGVVSESITPSM